MPPLLPDRKPPPLPGIMFPPHPGRKPFNGFRMYGVECLAKDGAKDDARDDFKFPMCGVACLAKDDFKEGGWVSRVFFM